MIDELLEELKKNPHFMTLPEVLHNERIEEAAFRNDMRNRLVHLLKEHMDDNEGLKEESHHYILPAIAVYQTLQAHSPNALLLFREMWLNGARLGAEHLRKLAQDDHFLQSWIPSVTPKKTETGAFKFRIDHVTESETEYHVLRCPYVQLCDAYECSEIITVFCDSDDISFGNIHPRLIWGRTKTIGRGNPYCDFKYTLLKEECEEVES